MNREDASTSPSLTLDCVLVANPNNRSMTFPIMLQGKNKTIDTSALIDSGATGNFMDLQLLSKNNFVLVRLPTPILAYNIDGTTNQKGTIRWKAKTILTLGDHSHPIELIILRLNVPRVILGIPWLKKWNPKINLPCLSMTIPSFPHPFIPYHAWYLGLDVDHELSLLLATSSPPVEDDWSLCEYHLRTGGANEHINKITISTQLAQADKPKDIAVPDFCASFADVFSEQTYNILPPHCPFDHTIELKDSFIPKIAKVYPLNPAEKDACKAFIDEHLKTGCILPSKSPQASPFFFLPKKDGTLQPCQDY